MKHSGKPHVERLGGAEGEALAHAIYDFCGEDTGALRLQLKRLAENYPTSHDVDQRTLQRAIYVIEDVLDKWDMRGRRPNKTSFTCAELEALAALPKAVGTTASTASKVKLAFAAHIAGPLEDMTVSPAVKKFRGAIDQFWSQYGEKIELWMCEYETDIDKAPQALRLVQRHMLDVMKEYTENTKELSKDRSDPLEVLLEPSMAHYPPATKFRMLLHNAHGHMKKEHDKDPQNPGKMAEEWEAKHALQDFDRMVQPLVTPAVAEWKKMQQRGPTP